MKTRTHPSISALSCAALLTILQGCDSALEWLSFSIGELTVSVPPNELISGACTSVTVTRAAYAPSAPQSALAVSLASSRSGSFFEFSGCSNSTITQINFLAADLAKTVYYAPLSSGTHTITATASEWQGGSDVITYASTLVDLSNSYITLSDANPTAGDDVTVTFFARDGDNNPVVSGVASFLRLAFTNHVETPGLSWGRLSPLTDNGDGSFSANLSATGAGSPNSIVVKISGTGVVVNQPSFTVTPGTFSTYDSVVHIEHGMVPLDASTTVFVFARDAFNNPVTIPSFSCAESMPTASYSRVTFGSTVTDLGGGAYSITVDGDAMGTPNNAICSVPGYGSLIHQPAFVVSQLSIASAPPQTTWWNTAVGNFQVNLTLHGSLGAGDQIVCRVKKPADGATGFTACDGSGGTGTTLTQSVPGLGATDGFFDFEAGILLFGQAAPVGVIKRRFYFHSSLSGKSLCTSGPTDAQYITKAKQILGKPVGVFGPSSQFQGPLVSYNRIRPDGYLAAQEARTLRKRFSLSPDRAFVVLRRSFEGDSGVGCEMRFNARSSGIRRLGGTGNANIALACDAMVFDVSGRSVCLTSSLNLVRAFGAYGSDYAQQRQSSIFHYPFKPKATASEDALGQYPGGWSGLVLPDL